jgi:hypothetical protein
MAKYDAVIKKVIDKSEAGTLPWKTTYNDNSFILALEGEVSFEVSRLDFGGFQFVMKDKDGKSIIDLTAHNRKKFQDEDWVEEDVYFADIKRIFEAARVTALEVNKKLNDAESLLDSF